ncbi:MAG: aminotransferase class I/II-fold pyridoxal phosphate-dependent enzyme, partial [Lachnospiraceae bacterium]|nr:aminotransferase class I/II-fold pyridoxal phosphate-dependent enzyme [Lachnospiraceae bacterium]
MSNKLIPLSVPNLKGNELKYVSSAIESEWVSTAGPYVNAFEEKFAEYVNTLGAVSCQSGTAGLHIALILTGLTKDDAVLVPTLTFIAAINPVKYIGASPIFMDCDDSLCIDPEKVEEFCKNECDFVEGRLIERESRKHIKVLLAVHVFGNMSDMGSLTKIAKKYNLKVVEDATEALGTHYTDGIYKECHAGTIGEIGVYSFNGNKIITGSSGGF